LVRCSAQRRASTKGRRKDSSRGMTPRSRPGGTSASAISSSRRTRYRRSMASSVHGMPPGGIVPQRLAPDRPIGHSRTRQDLIYETIAAYDPTGHEYAHSFRLCMAFGGYRIPVGDFCYHEQPPKAKHRAPAKTEESEPFSLPPSQAADPLS